MTRRTIRLPRGWTLEISNPRIDEDHEGMIAVQFEPHALPYTHILSGGWFGRGFAVILENEGKAGAL